AASKLAADPPAAGAAGLAAAQRNGLATGGRFAPGKVVPAATRRGLVPFLRVRDHPAGHRLRGLAGDAVDIHGTNLVGIARRDCSGPGGDLAFTLLRGWRGHALRPAGVCGLALAGGTGALAAVPDSRCIAGHWSDCAVQLSCAGSLLSWRGNCAPRPGDSLFGFGLERRCTRLTDNGHRPDRCGPARRGFALANVALCAVAANFAASSRRLVFGLSALPLGRGVHCVGGSAWK